MSPHPEFNPTDEPLSEVERADLLCGLACCAGCTSHALRIAARDVLTEIAEEAHGDNYVADCRREAIQLMLGSISFELVGIRQALDRLGGEEDEVLPSPGLIYNIVTDWVTDGIPLGWPRGGIIGEPVEPVRIVQVCKEAAEDGGLVRWRYEDGRPDGAAVLAKFVALAQRLDVAS